MRQKLSPPPRFFLFYLPSLVLVACLFLTPACQKPSINDNPGLTAASVSSPFNQNLLAQSSSASQFDAITVQDGMLVFQDKAHFDTTLRVLEDMDHAWVDEVEVDEEMVIIPDEALEAFEQMFDFYSLRKFIEEDERTYLESGGQELGTMLDATHHVMDDYLRTVFNPHCEVIIGDGIFKLLPDDLVIEITDGSFETLLAARDYFENPERFLVPLPEILRQGTLQLHFPDDNSIIIPHLGSGSQVEGCPAGLPYDSYQVNWRTGSLIGGNLSVSISDNSLWIQSHSQEITADGHDLLIATDLTGSNFVPEIINGPGDIGNYTHMFNGDGPFLMCLTQRFVDQQGILCYQVSDCDTVSVSCCEKNEHEHGGPWLYDNDPATSIPQGQYTGKFRVRNNFLEHKLKTRTKNYRRKRNGRFAQRKANDLRAGIVEGSTIYFKSSEDKECDVAEVLQGLPLDRYETTLPNKKRITHTYRVGQKFYMKNSSVAGISGVRWGGQPEISETMNLTNRCN